MAFMFEDEDGDELPLRDDALDRVASLVDGWCDPIDVMSGHGYKLVGADEVGKEWLLSRGYKFRVTADQPLQTTTSTAALGKPKKRPPCGDIKEKQWYTTQDVAALLGLAAYTVRSWCWRGLIECRKSHRGHGRSKSWLIPHHELVRLQNERSSPICERAK